MINIITEFSSLPAIKEDWNRLAARFKTPLLEFDWFISCLESFQRDCQLYVVTIRQEKIITAIAPLCLSSKSGNPSLEIIGSSFLFEPAGLLYEDLASLEILLKALTKLNYPVTLFRIPTDVDDFEKALQQNIKNAIILKKTTACSNYIDINSTWDEFLAQLSSNRRYDFKRKRKHLSKEGKIRLDIIKPTTDELNIHFKAALEVENKSWKGANKSSLLKNQELRTFFEIYTKKACYNDKLTICFIYVNDEPVSMHIAIIAYNCFWVLKLGYDEALSKYSPGILLAMDTIEYSFRQKLGRYEFLGSDEKWQHGWPINQHQYITLLIFPYSYNGIKGFLKTVLGIVIAKIKRNK